MKLFRLFTVSLFLISAFALVGCGSSDDEGEGANNAFNNPGNNNNNNNFNNQNGTYSNNPNLTVQQIKDGVNNNQFAPQSAQQQIAVYYREGSDMCYITSGCSEGSLDNTSFMYSLNQNQSNLYEGGHNGFFDTNNLPSNVKSVTSNQIRNHLQDLVNNGQFVDGVTQGFNQTYYNIHQTICGLGFWIKRNGYFHLISFDCPLYMNPIWVVEDETWFPKTRRRLDNWL
jgi:hypothetical protein